MLGIGLAISCIIGMILTSLIEAPGVGRQRSFNPRCRRGYGSFHSLNLCGKDAGIQEVAEDLRNHRPTILFVCCHDSVAANDMQIALSNLVVDETRGDGGIWSA